MTDKKKPRKGVQDKARRLYDDTDDPQNGLMPEDVDEALGLLHYYLTRNGEQKASDLFVLIIHALAHEPDEQVRASIYDATLHTFSLDLDEVPDAVRRSLTKALDELREGRASQ